MEYQEIPLEQAYESPLNNRRHFDEVALDELTESVRQKGVLTPLLMRHNPQALDATGKLNFEILAGARRYRAAARAGLPTVPARVGRFEDGEALEIIVLENLQREDLHPLEEAEGYRALLEQPGYDVAAIAAKVHKSESYVHQRIKLTELIEPAREAFLTDRILLGHALLIARLQPDDQAKAFKLAFREQWRDDAWGPHVVSVRELAKGIEDGLLRNLSKAAFDRDDAELVPAAGACATCPKRTGAAPSLFPDIERDDTCTDGSCFQAKTVAHLEARAAALTTAKGEAPLRLSLTHKKRKGVVAAGDWARAKAKECDGVRKGLVVEADHEASDLGKVLTVCAEPACTVHRSRAASSGTSSRSKDDWEARQQRENSKRALRTEINRRIFTAVVDRVPKKLGRPELERLARDFFENIAPDDYVLIAPLFGVDAPAKGLTFQQRQKYADTLRTRLPQLTEPFLACLLAVLPLVQDVDGYRAFDGSELCGAATQYGVDVAAIEAAVKAEAKEKADAEKAAAKVKAAKVRKGAGGKKVSKTGAGELPAATGFDPESEPTCESCGCTEAAACPDGCAWDETFQAQGRAVCTTPACLKAAKKVKAAKKAKDSKKGKAKK